MGHGRTDPGRLGGDRGGFGTERTSRQVRCFAARRGGGPIVGEHRDRFCRFGCEFEAALAGQGRERVVVDSAEVDDDLVGEMTEILTGMCARRYGERAAANRAKRAMTAVGGCEAV